MTITLYECLHGLSRLLLIVVGLSTVMTVCHASDIKTDEEVVFFTTNARWDTQTQQWHVPVHGWIFEQENDSLWRSALLDVLIRQLDLKTNVVQDAIFRERAAMFLVDNERNKSLTVRVGAQNFPATMSEANGHFRFDVHLSAMAMNEYTSAGWLPVSLVMPKGDKRSFNGRIQRLATQGLSVISDIDDTVKISNVLDKQQLLHNTFLKPFVAVPGMAQAYQAWLEQGATFHYVSSSPWQLYPALSRFFAESGLPHGSFHLKTFRIKDETFLDLFASPLETKLAAITKLLDLYPDRRFILVGDSGERDPEVYAEVVKHYPERIEHVFIRNVTNETSQAERYAKLFAGDLGKRFTVFTDAGVLQNFGIAQERGVRESASK